MRDWPWFWIILGAVAISSFVPLGLDGWVNITLFWAAVVGAIAYGAYTRRA